MSTWVNDKRHTWKEWRYGHSSLAVDGKTDTTLSNCAIMDNYYVESPVWMVDLGKETTVNGLVAITWQGAGQGNLIELKAIDLDKFIKLFFGELVLFIQVGSQKFDFHKRCYLRSRKLGCPQKKFCSTED
jgi:hypothetical protein